MHDQDLLGLSELYDGTHAHGFEVYNGTADQEYCAKLLCGVTAFPGLKGKLLAG